jgi:type III secretion protein Q
MSLWNDMETLALPDVERHNHAVRFFGRAHSVSVGTRRFTLQFESSEGSLFPCG